MPAKKIEVTHRRMPSAGIFLMDCLCRRWRQGWKCEKSKMRQVVPDEIGLVQSAVFAISMFYAMMQILLQYIKSCRKRYIFNKRSKIKLCIYYAKYENKWCGIMQRK